MRLLTTFFGVPLVEYCLIMNDALYSHDYLYYKNNASELFIYM